MTARIKVWRMHDAITQEPLGRWFFTEASCVKLGKIMGRITVPVAEEIVGWQT